MRKPKVIPKTRTITKLVSSLTYEELTQCRRLYNRHGGTRIVSDLAQARKDPGLKSKVILVKDDNDKVLSWGLIDNTEPQPTFQVYTHGNYRRIGLGTKVISRAKKMIGDKFVHFPCSDTAQAFFNHHKIKHPEYTPWH